MADDAQQRAEQAERERDEAVAREAVLTAAIQNIQTVIIDWEYAGLGEVLRECDRAYNPSPRAAALLDVVEKAHVVLDALIEEHGEPIGVVKDLADSFAALKARQAAHDRT